MLRIKTNRVKKTNIVNICGNKTQRKIKSEGKEIKFHYNQNISSDKMTHQKSTASKDFSRLQPNLLPPDRNGHPGKSCPINDTFPHFSMVGVYETRKGLKFVHITSKKLEGKYTVLIFMDNKLTPIEAEEWKEFSDMLDQFKKVGAQVMGVCTDSHVTIRTMVMQSQNLQGIKFPIISDRDGDFSRALGVLKLKNGEFGAARALILLDRDVELQ